MDIYRIGTMLTNIKPEISPIQLFGALLSRRAASWVQRCKISGSPAAVAAPVDPLGIVCGPDPAINLRN
jgi:hypothetical protein